MRINEVIHIMDCFNDYGRKMGYEVETQVCSTKDFYATMTTAHEYEIEVGIHQFADESTKVSIEVSKVKGAVSMTWAAYDNTIVDTIDFEYICGIAKHFIDSLNRLPEDVVNPPMRSISEDNTDDWWC